MRQYLGVPAVAGHPVPRVFTVDYYVFGELDTAWWHAVPAQGALISLGGGGCAVQPLANRSSSSPDGFNWGYLGSGPQALAVSLLWDVLRCAPPADLVRRFKGQRVATWPRGKAFTIPRDEVAGWVAGCLVEGAMMASVTGQAGRAGGIPPSPLPAGPAPAPVTPEEEPS